MDIRSIISSANSQLAPIRTEMALAHGYRLVLCDDSLTVPFALTPELACRAQSFMNLAYAQRGRAIFDYLRENLSYRAKRPAKNGAGYQSAAETWEMRQGLCGEQTYLYVAMARCAGLRAQYASVREDLHGNPVVHACAALEECVRVQGCARLTLVDLAYDVYGARHRRWRPLEDETAWGLFRAWRSAAQRK